MTLGYTFWHGYTVYGFNLRACVLADNPSTPSGLVRMRCALQYQRAVHLSQHFAARKRAPSVRIIRVALFFRGSLRSFVCLEASFTAEVSFKWGHNQGC